MQQLPTQALRQFYRLDNDVSFSPISTPLQNSDPTSLPLFFTVSRNIKTGKLTLNGQINIQQVTFGQLAIIATRLIQQSRTPGQRKRHRNIHRWAGSGWKRFRSKALSSAGF